MVVIIEGALVLIIEGYLVLIIEGYMVLIIKGCFVLIEVMEIMQGMVMINNEMFQLWFNSTVHVQGTLLTSNAMRV